MLSLLVLAVAPVTFNGGSPSELAKSIAEATKANVVIEAGPSERFNSFSYDPSNLDEMARAILKATELKQAPGEDFVYSHPWLPAWHFQNKTIQQYLNDNMRMCPSGSLPENFLNQGIVTVHAKPGSAISIEALEGIKFARPLTVDGFFMNLGLNIWVTDMPERDFLNYVAKAVGGKLKPTKEGLSLVPSGQDIQRRALLTIDRVKKLESFAKRASLEKAELELSRTAIAAATSSQLEELYAEEGKPVRMEIGPATRNAVVQLIRAMMEPPPEANPGFGPPQQTADIATKPEERFRNVDRRILGSIVLSRGFMAWAELATVDQLGRSGPPMRVP